MFCTKCGKTLADTARFCPGCGQAAEPQTEAIPQDTQAQWAPQAEPEPVPAPIQQEPMMAPEPIAPPVPEYIAAPAPAADYVPPVQAPYPAPVQPVGAAQPEAPKKKGLALVVGAAAVAVLALAAIFVLAILPNMGRNYLYKALSASGEAYTKELELFVSGNDVLKQLSESQKGASQQTIMIDQLGTLTVTDDAKDLLALTASLNGSFLGMPDLTAGLYLNKNGLILGSDELMYVSVPGTGLAKELRTFLEKNDLDPDDLPDALWDMLGELELTYSVYRSQLSGKAEPTKEQKDFNTALTGVLKALVGKAEYSKDKGEITIGGKTQKCDTALLTLDQDMLLSWIAKDLRPFVKNNAYLKELCAQYDELQKFGYSLDSYSFSRSSDLYGNILDALDDMEDELEDIDLSLEVTFYIYKKTIVRLDVNGKQNREKFEMTLQALGEKYRLDDISCEMKQGSTTNYFSIVGSHINTNSFETVIRTGTSYSKNDKYESKIRMEWDVKGSGNNFSVRTDDGSIRFKLTTEGKDVVAKLNLEDLGIYIPYYYPQVETITYTLSALKDAPAVPAKTTTLAALDLEELMELFEDFLYDNGFYY